MVWLDRSDNKNTAIFAISSVVVMRCSNGILDTIEFNFSSGLDSVFSQFSYKGVQHSATIMAFTLMP